MQAASQGAGGAALPGGAALWVRVDEVREQVCDWGSGELCLGPALREGGWRHQRASHAEAAGLAGAAGTGVSEAVPLAGLTSAWKWSCSVMRASAACRQQGRVWCVFAGR